MSGSNELGLRVVDFSMPVIYRPSETWVQGWKVLWQLGVSLCCRTKEIFTVIDKACHSWTPYFKARQQGYVGLASKLRELIRKTFLAVRQSHHRVSTGAILWMGVGCSQVLSPLPELSEADRATELFLSLTCSSSFMIQQNCPDIFLLLQ